MTDLEKDLRAAAYHIGAAIPYLQRVGRTIVASIMQEELRSIESALQAIEFHSQASPAQIGDE